jgi:DNA recombination protein RmuC
LEQQVRTEGEQKVKAQTELTQAQVSLQEQRKLLDAAEQKLKDTFKALADDVLKSNNQAFIDLARTTFDVIQTQAKGDLEARQQAIDGLVQPLKQSLERYEQQVREMEGARRSAYGGLVEQLQNLQKVTGSLDAALRTSQGRGLWGQLQLRRVVELAGMSEHCDFTEQETLTSETGQQRPDMIVNLPGGIRIAVDAKVPLQAFLDADAAATDAERTSLLARH